MNVAEWLQQGVDAGFCSKPWCETHEAPVLAELLTDDESLRWLEDGEDGCISVVRLFEDG